MANTRKTWKQRREQQRRENFIGRREHLREFSEDFTGAEPQYMVFSVTGEGGVGKSTLLGQYANLAAAASGALVIICDDRQTTPAQAMGHIAAELAKLDIRHDKFDERYKKYRELRDEIESDPKAPRGAVDLLARGVTDLAIKSGRRIPGAGLLLEGVDEKSAGETVSQLINYGITRWGNKDEVALLRETDRVLAPLFLGLLARAAERRRVLLIFDVFERTSAALGPWLLTLFNFEHGDLDANLGFVIAGRDPLEQHWTELAGNICHVALDPFTPEETALYLANQEITDERLVNQIHEDTGGLPVLVELLASTRPEPGAPLADVSRDAVERFLQWIPQEDRRRAALLAAVPRRFNLDNLGAALGADATETFQWLSTQSFVRRNADTGWFYHERVRELMLRHLRQTTPKDLDETHARLATFFAAEQAALNLEGEAAYESESWKRCECDRVYHSLSAQPDRNRHEALNAFLHAFRWRWKFANEIARACRQCGREKDSTALRELADALADFYRAYDQDEFQDGIDRLDLLETHSNLTSIARCEIRALRGFLHFRVGKYDKALADLSRAIELDEKYAWAIAVRGETYRLMERYEEALLDFNRAIELDEKSASAIARRGRTYRLMGQYEEALLDFNRAIELNEKYAWAIACRGQTYQSMERYEEALLDFNRAIELDEKSAWAIALRGLTYRLMGQYEEALLDFNRAIELNEKYAWAIACRGLTYQSMERYEEALLDFNRAIELDEKSAWAIALRGLTYQSMERYEEALLDFNRAIELNEKYDWAIARRGETYRLMERYEEALLDFNRVIELNEKSAWAIARRGETYRLMERYEEALLDFNRAIELDEKLDWAIASRGMTYRSMERYEEALLDFNRAIELDEKDASAIASRGMTYRLMERYEEALLDFNRAIELDEKDASAIASRGMTYRLMERYEEALLDFNRAIELDEKLDWAIASRGETYRLMKRYEEALLDFNRAIELDEKLAWAIASRGQTYQSMERYEEALLDFNRAIELDEKLAWAIASRGETYQSMERYEEALLDFNRAIESDANKTTVHVSLIACYRKLGRMDEYRRQIEIARALFEKESTYGRACFAAVCGEEETALALLRTALENGEVTVAWVRTDPDFEWLRQDTRFSALLADMAARA